MTNRRQQIFDVIVEELKNQDVPTELSLDLGSAGDIRLGDLQLDSLAMLTFIMETENTLDLEIDAEFTEQTSLAEVVDWIEAIMQDR